MALILALGFGTAAVTPRADGSTSVVTTVINGIKVVIVRVTSGPGSGTTTTTTVPATTSTSTTPVVTTPVSTSPTTTSTTGTTSSGKGKTATTTTPGGTVSAGGGGNSGGDGDRDGSATGSDDAAAETPAGPVVLGQTAAVAPVSGDVRVKLPGRDDYEPLADAGSIPMGTTVDASDGAVRLTSAHDAAGTPQTAQFRGGTFVVKGQTTGKAPVTNLTLAGGNFDAACGKAALRTAKKAAKHPPVRQLWGSGHGRFKTRGRYSAATVRGTIWLTRDSCDGTLTVVKRGIVAVHDYVLDKTVMVKAGSSYFARAPLPVKAATALLGF